MEVYDTKSNKSNREGFLYFFYIAGRITEDRFCIILPHCSGENALKTSQHILESMKEIRIPEEKSYFSITASIGIAVYDPYKECDNEDIIIRLAEEALAIAKEKDESTIELSYF